VENLILVGSGHRSGTGNSSDNEITGNAGNNVLAGGAGNDTLIGEDGNDVLDGSSGIDSMVGGAGDDTYYVNTWRDQVIEDANGGIDTVRAAPSYTLGNELENLILIGSGDRSGTGNSSDNQIVGSGVTVDLTKIESSAIAGIEIIDIQGSGNNSLLLSLEDVFDISDTTDTLTIDGDTGDTLTVTSGTWADGGRLGDYNVYTSNMARLNVYWQVAAEVTTA
jgi:hypothetical protein